MPQRKIGFFVKIKEDENFNHSSTICRTYGTGSNTVSIRIRFSFQFRNENFFARSRKSKNCAEAYNLYAAQAILKIDAEIAEKGHFRTGNYMNLLINSSITSSTFSGVMPNCLQDFSALSRRRGFSKSLRREKYPSLLPT